MISISNIYKKKEPGIVEKCKVSSRCNVLLINKLGGIGDILCTRLIFEDLKQVPKIGKITFAVPRMYLSLIEDHPYIDYKVAIEDLDKKDFDKYILVKDLTQVPGQIEHRTMPNVTKNRSDILAESIGLKLKSHRGHLTFSCQEIDWAQKYIRKFGQDKKVGIAPFTAHASKDLPYSFIEELVFWCRRKGFIPIVFHDKKIRIKNAEMANDLTLRQWMAVVSLLDAVVVAASAMFWISQLTYRPTVAIFGCEDLKIFGKYHLNLTSIQRRSNGRDRLPYATITSKQKSIKEFEGEWLYCPCWDARKCPFKKWGEYPTLCLESIKIKEVVEPLFEILNPSSLKNKFEENYFMKKGCSGWYHKEAWGHKNIFHKAYSRFLLEVIKPKIGNSLLDVGAAFGDLVYHLQVKCIQAYGIDISKYTVKNKHVDTLKMADVSMYIPFESNFFDYVISRDCLEHIPEKGIYHSLENIKRVLRPGGLAFLQIATNYRDKEFEKRKDDLYKDPTHVSIRDISWWKNLLERIGFLEDREILQRAKKHPMFIENQWEVLTYRK
jgi:SAM-dependent methyltransferase/ADP-heptose:LPS heptosyltransferase